ncbi:MAG: class II aldolase/adducin family protein [Thermoproteales archaeon]|nr:class II aldolase/adducin family protein [Thermoproteales archaeon]
MELTKVMRILYERKYISSLSGNASVREPGSSEFWITPSGIFKGALKPSDIIKMSVDGRVLEGRLKPSSEWRFHAAIYRKRKDVNAVIHAHNPITVALTMAGITIKPVTAEGILFLRKIKIIPYAPPGSQELAGKVAKGIEDCNALILEKHGVVAVGRNLTEAEAIIETLEDEALVHFIIHVFHALHR